MKRGLTWPGLHYFVDFWMQTYTEPVPSEYGKLATKCWSICGYFYSVWHHYMSSTPGDNKNINVRTVAPPRPHQDRFRAGLINSNTKETNKAIVDFRLRSPVLPGQASHFECTPNFRPCQTSADSVMICTLVSLIARSLSSSISTVVYSAKVE